MNGQTSLEEILRQQQRSLVSLPLGHLRNGLDLARAQLGSALVKVILGPRRAGKSTFALQLLASSKYAYLNFDDENLLSSIARDGSLKLLRAVAAVYGDEKLLFIDEVQNLPGWELFVNRLHRERYNLVLTGSNANLLSSELATHLTGRYVEFEIMPFSYSEYLRVRPNGTVDEYSRLGGFPEVITSKIEPTSYLSTLANAVIYKDIVRRFKLREPAKLGELWQSLRAQFAQTYTISKLAAALDFSSKSTLQNYLKYIQGSYLISELTRYNTKFREQLKAPRKGYLADLGYIEQHLQPFDVTSRRFENLVYLHLYRALDKTNQTLYYAKTASGREIDFVIKSGTKISALMQVAYTIEHPETREREIRALREAAEEMRCKRLLVITNSTRCRLEEQGQTIELVAAEDLLLGRVDL